MGQGRSDRRVGACRWLLNSQALCLAKGSEPTSKAFDDEERSWIAPVAEEGPEVDAYAHSAPTTTGEDAGARVGMRTAETSDADVASGTTCSPTSAEADEAAAELPKVKVRPIQMGEFVRTCVREKLLKFNEAYVGKDAAAMRPIGVGALGGAVALAIFEQFLYELRKAGRLLRPLARVKVDEKICFGVPERRDAREASRGVLPQRYVVHAAASAVEQPGVEPLLKDRSAEQGDVDGLAERSLTCGGVAGPTR
jgi:hypothetical protein